MEDRVKDSNRSKKSNKYGYICIVNNNNKKNQDPDSVRSLSWRLFWVKRP